MKSKTEQVRHSWRAERDHTKKLVQLLRDNGLRRSFGTWMNESPFQCKHKYVGRGVTVRCDAENYRRPKPARSIDLITQEMRDACYSGFWTTEVDLDVKNEKTAEPVLRAINDWYNGLKSADQNGSWSSRDEQEQEPGKNQPTAAHPELAEV